MPRSSELIAAEGIAGERTAFEAAATLAVSSTPRRHGCLWRTRSTDRHARLRPESAGFRDQRPYFCITCRRRSCGSAITLWSLWPVIVSAPSIALTIASSVA